MVIPILDKSFWTNRNVFVTGHTGFKGTWLSSILLHAGANVTGYSQLPPTDPSLFDILNLKNDIDSVIGDIRNLESLQEAFIEAKPEIVFHLAAQPIVRESYSNPVYTYETNVMGTVNILECLRGYGGVGSFINVTTDKVYENKEWFWGYRENDNLCGSDPYSNSKSCSELVTSSYTNSFFQSERSTAISTARSGNVIGGGDFAANRIIPDCVRAVENKRSIVVRNPHSIRPYQHVLDCLSGYLLLAQMQYQQKRKYEGCYNFGPDDTDFVTTGALVDMFCREWGPSADWISVPDDGPHEARTLRLDCSKAKATLGWSPMFSIQEAVHMTVEWYQAYDSKADCQIVTSQQINKCWS
ncbi:CDP-glucose 4,6-dehydratase [Paenibacillus timonensis]|uniref:CDP-glucose 4,6-dehydratase n=1 Tax=Paenibacillus timonensis TaxID=225915 RepID=UPI003F9585B8